MLADTPQSKADFDMHQGLCRNQPNVPISLNVAFGLTWIARYFQCRAMPTDPRQIGFVM